MNLDFEKMLDLLQKGGLLFVAILIFFGGYKQLWVWGYQLEEIKKDRDEWKARALHSMGLVDRAINVASSQQQQPTVNP